MSAGGRRTGRGAIALGLVGLVVLVSAGALVGAALQPTAADSAGETGGASARYPGDLPVDAPLLSGALLSSSGGDGIWSLRYSRDGLTPEEALADLGARGYAEDHRSRDENDVVRVSLLGSSPYLIAVSWSDDDDQAPIDLLLRSPERRGIG
ncbi:hypothetical protein GSU68_17595 [Rathayibacter sp. VKM Ac-2759]|uniref:hypothetical protein n=1 Tax=Rathayibacter sp. VKM Ac-2759 TaxID=2609252 RepID=UPI0013193B1D|nr:hypothetical protein [Rathayibacter sp. VKM Ac-2759]QHC68205.1 hypothetical protein GSU68_17595 [Rathayibacter sp. VKM Ac-2759]